MEGTVAMSESKDLLLRSITLLQLIPRWPKSISTRDLLDKLKAEGFQINLRSLQRDLRDLSSRLAIVNNDEDTRPYRWSIREGANHGLPAQETPSSALALYLAESHLSHLLPQSVLDLLRPQFRSARNQLDGMQHNHLAHWARRVRSLPNGKALLPAELQPQVWTQVSNALLERRQLQVDYLSRSQGASKRFRLHLAGLVSRHSISYLIGTVNDYADLRQFALHRIQSAELLDEPAREHEDFDIDRYIEGGAFAWRQSPHEVELIADIHPQLAWLLGETPAQPRTTPRTAARQRLAMPARHRAARPGNPVVDLRPQRPDPRACAAGLGGGDPQQAGEPEKYVRRTSAVRHNLSRGCGRFGTGTQRTNRSGVHAMLKNILAAVGAFFVVKKGYEHYQEYSELKREKKRLQEQ